MKLIKNTQFGEINTSIDGVLYKITQEGIEVPDEVADKMAGQFLHTVEVSEVTVAPAEVVETPEVEVETQSPVVEPKIE